VPEPHDYPPAALVSLKVPTKKVANTLTAALTKAPVVATVVAIAGNTKPMMIFLVNIVRSPRNEVYSCCDDSWNFDALCSYRGGAMRETVMPRDGFAIYSSERGSPGALADNGD
jgi:hypothetical protein